jgi:hypothetical protein
MHIAMQGGNKKERTEGVSVRDQVHGTLGTELVLVHALPFSNMVGIAFPLSLCKRQAGKRLVLVIRFLLLFNKKKSQER